MLSTSKLAEALTFASFVHTFAVYDFFKRGVEIAYDHNPIVSTCLIQDEYEFPDKMPSCFNSLTLQVL